MIERIVLLRCIVYDIEVSPSANVTSQSVHHCKYDHIPIGSQPTYSFDQDEVSCIVFVLEGQLSVNGLYPEAPNKEIAETDGFTLFVYCLFAPSSFPILNP